MCNRNSGIVFLQTENTACSFILQCLSRDFFRQGMQGTLLNSFRHTGHLQSCIYGELHAHAIPCVQEGVAANPRFLTHWSALSDSSYSGKSRGEMAERKGTGEKKPSSIWIGFFQKIRKGKTLHYVVISQ